MNAKMMTIKPEAELEAELQGDPETYTPRPLVETWIIDPTATITWQAVCESIAYHREQVEAERPKAAKKATTKQPKPRTS